MDGQVQQWLPLRCVHAAERDYQRERYRRRHGLVEEFDVVGPVGEAVHLEPTGLDADRPTLAAVAMRLVAVLDNPNAYTAYSTASTKLIEVMDRVRRYSRPLAGV
jgi:hypothetical protein